MEVLSEAPSIGSFVPLSEHESATPASFYSGPAVLHYYSDRCKVIVLEDELSTVPALQNLAAQAKQPLHSNDPDPNGNTSTGEQELENIDVWVTSDKLRLYSTTCSTGVSIPYQAISLHAIQSLPVPDATEPQSQGLYMQLIPNSSGYENDDDDDLPDTISVTIIPTASAPPPSTAPIATLDDAVESEDKPEITPVMALFTALSNCANLHPDLADPEDEEAEAAGSRLMQAGLALPGMNDGGLPPPMPGSGGWITAENMHEYVDEQGNWIGGDDDMEQDETTESLGLGAGTVRTRGDGHVNGSDETGNHDDTKWQRTS